MDYRRIIVFNLGFEETKETVRSYFESEGKVKVSFFYDSQGKFGGVAKIKYEAPENARNAVTKFHNTYLNGKNIRVEPDASEIKKKEEEKNKHINNLEHRIIKLEKENISLKNRNESLEKENEKKTKRIDILNEKIRTIILENKFLQNCYYNSSPFVDIVNLIPQDQIWNYEGNNYLKNSLFYEGNFYIVEVSSIDVNNPKGHLPSFLFDSNNVWATDSAQDYANIIIRFGKPMSANVLTMKSRNILYKDQVPKNFEIFGYNEEDKFVHLNSYNNVKWESNSKRNFNFHNMKEYYNYKICLYSNDNARGYFGLAELNIGIIHH